MTAWNVTLQPPPPSWNNSYRIGTQYRTKADGTNQRFSTIIKREKLTLWQAQQLLVVRSARPSHWQPEGWVRIWWRVFLNRHIDMDNLQKATNDVIEAATGVDDKWYLPIFEEAPMIGVPRRDARIELLIIG